jgi:hypothetical protein
MITTGLGYKTLYYNENYETIINELINKKTERSQIFNNLINKLWSKKINTKK